jgi:UDP-N-acetylmuramate dehydrogenase
MPRLASIDAAADVLSARVEGRLRRDVPLAPMTTYRVGGAAALFLDVASPADLVAVAEVRAMTGLPVIVVGKGSNMLVADTGFDGLAVSVAGFASTIEIPDVRGDDHGAAVTVVAGGGVALPVLARRTAAGGVRGFEWAVGVPGSIGGAVRMNAGGHGSDMAASLLDVNVIDLDESGATRTQRRRRRRGSSRRRRARR